jgi:hypothetical protein
MIADCHQQLSFFSFWTALKVFRCVKMCNSQAHSVTKWVASHLVFGNIIENSHFLLALRIRSSKSLVICFLFFFFPFLFLKLNRKKKKEKKKRSRSIIRIFVLFYYLPYKKRKKSNWSVVVCCKKFCKI